MQIEIQSIQLSEHYSAALVDQVAAFNADLASLHQRQRNLPSRRASLADKAIAGDLNGSEVIAMLGEINGDEPATLVDAIRAFLQKRELVGPIQKSCTAQAAKVSAEADKRRKKLEKLAEGHTGRPAERESFVKSDGNLRELQAEVRTLKAMAGNVISPEESRWFDAACGQIKQSLGVPVQANR